MPKLIFLILKKVPRGLSMLFCICSINVSSVCQLQFEAGVIEKDKSTTACLSDFDAAHNSSVEGQRETQALINDQEERCSCGESRVADHQYLMSNITTYLNLRSWGLFEQSKGAQVTILSQPKNGTVWIDESDVIYSPFEGFKGMDTLIYLVHGSDRSTCSDTLIMDVDQALPMELYMFDAFPDRSTNSVNLVWMTSTEVNNERFKIFRSNDAYSWRSILEVDGAGTSNSAIEYRALDEAPLNGIAYYKVRQIDYDGRFKASDIRVVDMDAPMNYMVFPNPSNGHFTIIDPEAILDPATSTTEVRLFDATGREVNLAIGGLTGRINVSIPNGIANGHYVLSVRNQKHLIHISR